MKHGTNTHDQPTDHAGALNSKHIQSKNHKAPLALKSTQLFWQAEPPHMNGWKLLEWTSLHIHQDLLYTQRNNDMHWILKCTHPSSKQNTNRNHGVHLGYYCTRGKQMLQHKRPQTRVNTPRRSNIIMETSRPHLPPVLCLSLNLIWRVVVTHLLTPE